MTKKPGTGITAKIKAAPGAANTVLENIIIQVVGPLLDATGTRWKTLIGLLAFPVAWGLHAFVEPALDPGSLRDWVHVADQKIELLAPYITGIGVVHRGIRAKYEPKET